MALDPGRDVAVQKLPLVVREELGRLGHVGEEEVRVDAVESHGLVDHVPTVAGRVDAAYIVIHLNQVDHKS